MTSRKGPLHSFEAASMGAEKGVEKVDLRKSRLSSVVVDGTGGLEPAAAKDE